MTYTDEISVKLETILSRIDNLDFKVGKLDLKIEKTREELSLAIQVSQEETKRELLRVLQTTKQELLQAIKTSQEDTVGAVSEVVNHGYNLHEERIVRVEKHLDLS